MSKLVLGLSVLGLVACGDDGSKVLPDAPLAPDAAIDAAPDTPVTLTITLDGAPVAGVDVYFVNPDGSLVAKTPTGADGVASAVVESGASVTARNPFGGAVPTGKGPSDELKTFMGVKPGDQLKLDDTFSGTGIQYDVTLPTEITADMYELHTSCGDYYTFGSGGSGTTPTTTIYQYNCPSPVNLLAIAYTNGNVTGWFYKADVAVADMGMLDLSSETYQTTTPDVTLTFANVPAAYTTVDIEPAQLTPRGPVWTQQYTVDVVNQMAMHTFQRPPVPGAVTATAIGLYGQGRTSHQLIDWGPASTIDLAGGLLHDYTADPTYTPATPTLTWAASGGATPDLASAQIYVYNQGVGMSYDWEIVAPYAAATIAFPTLPADAFPFAPSATDEVSIDELVTAKMPGGYDAVRASFFSLSGPEALISAATGRISIAFWQQRQPVRPTPASSGAASTRSRAVRR